MADEERYALRAKINAGMKSFLQKITFDEEGMVTLRWLPEMKEPLPDIIKDPDTGLLAFDQKKQEPQQVNRVWEMLFRDGKWLWNERMISEQLEEDEIEREEGPRVRILRNKDGTIKRDKKGRIRIRKPGEDHKRRLRDRARRRAKQGIIASATHAHRPHATGASCQAIR